ncbi:MAG: dTMP kinase [Candidatus Kerfeldbacteria bacterium RIFOXYA2_FULL_38_24]|uniref:Thymidylate kinase n=1 Tax=Candidatus Kerfeldbacteria bacterium RIFOXYB2_FULL_38_14 TaxID=1798547 RepID=A0A1G2BAU4_9BACT|nr:MAG: dTMP kinase [Candidatus Kerfeldbacteria bacterium RIFOXYB2_FULL_38_14]OGY86489.1 MAG: dTMP kinase [Candidatus Kerfeldbacteria bacterium RIFOXYA2_FULL_38_24]OGY90477.1 MAG: dTMP kinase [Candidatus Kerfeldbacteria bacterium RIFOXYC2_FULL_38_9]
MPKGKFIVFEGGEGSGKTSHIKFTARSLEKAGFSVLLTREPGGSPVCQRIREIILDKEPKLTSEFAELFLFFADRAQHVAEVILPALQQGKIVLCDRFSGSTFAYQLGGRALPDADFVKKMEQYSRQSLDPDLVVYLDVEVAVGLSRRQVDGGVDRIDAEKKQFHERVRNYFLQLTAENNNWLKVSTNAGALEENSLKVYQAVKKFLAL